ncbi:MAG: hypothetical protein ACT4NL_00225 [Pseudomarimonas sp.]
MSISVDVGGREFDWFAADSEGRLALFATAGFGPVPDSVLSATEAHDAVSDSLEVSDWGTSAVWESYALAGLYAYDWSDHQGSYLRVAQPAKLVPAALAAAIASIPGLLHFALSFSEVAAVTRDWHGSAKESVQIAMRQITENSNRF